MKNYTTTHAYINTLLLSSTWMSFKIARTSFNFKRSVKHLTHLINYTATVPSTVLVVVGFPKKQKVVLLVGICMLGVM